MKAWGAQLTEGKDPYQVGHSQRVADYATKLAREVGVEGWDLTWLRIGAFIHDLGNMAVPAEVLGEDATRSPSDEREIMKVHTIMGDSMAKQLDFPDEVRPIVRNHHEQWAGGGTPTGWWARRSRSGRGSSASRTCTMRSRSPRSFRPAYARNEDRWRSCRRTRTTMFDPNALRRLPRHDEAG